MNRRTRPPLDDLTTNPHAYQRFLYFATRDALDVALDRRDRDSAATLLTELDTHARALDTDTDTTTLASDVTQRRQRLTDLDPRP